MSDFRNKMRLEVLRLIIKEARKAGHALAKAKKLRWYGAMDQAREARAFHMNEARTLRTRIPDSFLATTPRP